MSRVLFVFVALGQDPGDICQVGRGRHPLLYMEWGLRSAWSKMPCTSPPRSSSTTTSPGCTRTTTAGWKGWPRTSRSARSYQHNRTGEDNADAHLKRQVMGREVVVAVTEGKLDFGPWEQIFYGEFDGRRRKRVLVKIIGE